ncbi:DUF6850 family outer membrane beta-barrel protein [Bacteroides coprosuis]|uniref:DUF6850 family outer membrane beta-barrel protein n=1 Tax=Bacteroides coprosuis TaxID=151276 RepID=UPI001DFF44F5|nr:DUF6850 family outer membrane beta-barrel protein [Bacteroides coprosuis]HJD91421.1 hypothetical protein [Bacteroides coprosuis]
MNIRYFSLFSLLICLSVGGKATEKDSLSLIQKKWLIEQPANQFMRDLYMHNPALRYYSAKTSISTIQLDGQTYRESEPINWQKGEKYRHYSISAHTLRELSANSLVWGGASYQNKTTKGLRFNNTSDYEKIAPYVLADTIGGQFYSETYQFQGGYLHHFKSKLTLGLELNYRAEIGYKRQDPRPKNIVSDLEFKLGISQALKKHYLVGMGFYFQNYKQQNTIQFFSSHLTTPIYHLTGLGMRSMRFDGTFYGVQFDGISYGANLNFQPQNQRGWFAHTSWIHTKVDKRISEWSNIPMNRLQSYLLEGTAGFQATHWAVKLVGEINTKEGTDYLYGKPQGRTLPKIGEEQLYNQEYLKVGIAGLWQTSFSTKNLEWVIEPQLSFQSLKESYDLPNRKLEKQVLNIKLLSTLRKEFNTGALTWKAQVDIIPHLSHSIVMSEMEEDNPIRPLIEQQMTLVSKNEIAGHTSIRWDLPFLISQKVSLFTQLNWSGRFIDHYKPAQQMGLTLGFIF